METLCYVCRFEKWNFIFYTRLFMGDENKGKRKAMILRDKREMKMEMSLVSGKWRMKRWRE